MVAGWGGEVDRMAKESSPVSAVKARVLEVLPNELFRVELADQSRVLAHAGSRRELDFLRLLPGTEVRVLLSPRDGGRARIVKRCEP